MLYANVKGEICQTLPMTTFRIQNDMAVRFDYTI